MRQVIAIFPLQYVLLPGLPLPLHIFEQRYRELIADVSATGTNAFGVVLGTSVASDALRTRPAGTGLIEANHSLAEVGTLAEIVENEPYADGRCDLLTVGSRRFRINSVDAQSRSYLRAEVDFLDETAESDLPADAPELARARTLSERYGEVLGQLTGAAPDDELAIDPLRASYEIAARLQLTTEDLQMLLETPTSTARLRAEIALLRRELAILRATRAVPVPAHALHVPSSRS